MPFTVRGRFFTPFKEAAPQVVAIQTTGQRQNFGITQRKNPKSIRRLHKRKRPQRDATAFLHLSIAIFREDRQCLYPDGMDPLPCLVVQHQNTLGAHRV